MFFDISGSNKIYRFNFYSCGFTCFQTLEKLFLFMTNHLWEVGGVVDHSCIIGPMEGRFALSEENTSTLRLYLKW